MRLWPNAGSMLGPPRPWSNIEPALGLYLVFDGYYATICQLLEQDSKSWTFWGKLFDVNYSQQAQDIYPMLF